MICKIIEEAYKNKLNELKDKTEENIKNFIDNPDFQIQKELFLKHWKLMLAGNVIGAGLGYEYAPEIGDALSQVDFEIPGFNGENFEINLEDLGEHIKDKPFVAAYIGSRIGNHIASIPYYRDQMKYAREKFQF
jgi:hypothetical protein